MLRSFILLSVVLMVFSCKEKATIYDENTPETTHYLTSFTRGMIYEDQNIVFQFDRDVDLDYSDITNAISTSPVFKFDLRYDTTHKSITVDPIANLSRDTEYKVTLDLTKLVNGVKDFKVVSDIKVHKQYVSVTRNGLVIDKQGNRYTQLSLNLAVKETDPNIKSIFKTDPSLITIKEEKSGNYTVLIKATKDQGTDVEWDATHLKSDEKGKILFWGSDLEGFNIVSTYHHRGNKSFTIYFSKLIDKSQDLDGLVLSGNNPVQYTITDNTIKIFLTTKTDEFQKLSIKQGIKSIDGDELSTDYEYDVSVNLLIPRIKWLEKDEYSQGNYIPNSGEFKIPFKSIGFKKLRVSVIAIDTERAGSFSAWNNIATGDRYELVRYGDFAYEEIIELDKNKSIDLEQWNEFGLDLTTSFQREKGYIYRVFLDYLPSYTILTCEDKSLVDFENSIDREKWFDKAGRMYDYYNYYNYNDTNNPCKSSFYINNQGISKNIHCTNVFPIIKKGENEITIAVKELLSEKIAGGAEVSILNLQGDVISSKKLTSTGIAKFEELKRDPKAVRIDYNNDISFFSISNGSENPITEFDVASGVRDIESRIFVYGERDVWRPSDTVFLNVMLNRTDFKFPEGQPIQVKFYNPKNVLYDSYLQQITSDNMIYTFKMPTDLEVLTGNWRAQINIGPHKKSTTIRIETIKPNVVDATFTFNNSDKEWIYDYTLSGKAKVEYLAGYAMKQGKVSASANIYNLSSPFEEHNNFQFSPLSTDNAKDVKIFSGITNQMGETSIKSMIDFKDYETVIQVILDTQIDLPGGGSNTETETFRVSPFESYVGIQKTEGKGWRGSFEYGDNPSLKLLHVDQKGKLISGSSTAELTVYKSRSDWWYDRYRLSRDHSVRSASNYTLVEQKTITFNNGITNYSHDNNNHGSGTYKVVLKDKKSGHVSEYTIHTITSLNYSVERNPEFIQIELENDSYKAGENMKLKLPAMQDAKALVSIEKGKKVLEAFWVDLDNPNLELSVKQEWFPNFYLNVSIVQTYGQQNNDRPLRMYGIEKILVNERNKVLNPLITSLDKVRPNESFTINVSEKTRQDMEYTLAIVDVGLLNITGFSTPNPLGHFNKLFSLMIRTWDIYSQLIFPGAPSFAGVFSIGGDGAIKKLDEAADFNRFEPVVFHLGPFTLEAGQTKRHVIHLPNYIGRLRATVVAANKTTFGSAEKDIKSASPLMIQTQLPRALNVTDKVQVPITIFKDEDQIKSVTITASNDNNALSFTNKNTSLDLNNEKQGLTDLAFTVGEITGNTNIKFNASSGSFKAEEATDIFINYPNGYSEKTTYFEVPSIEEKVIDIQSFGYDKTKNVDIAISGLILPSFTKYFHNLIRYPYGCLEQTSSRGYAMMYIDDLIKLNEKQKIKTRDYLDAALTKIGSFQTSEGKFKYWRNSYYHVWSDLYAGNFLLEAKNKGYLLKNENLKKWLEYTYKQANSFQTKGISVDEIISKEEMIQAYRLFILAKANMPAKSAMNRFRNQKLNPMAMALLGGSYHYAGMNDLGSDIFYEGLQEYKGSHYNYETFGSDIRDRSILLMLLTLFEKGERVDRFYKEWVIDLNKKRYVNTHEMGFALMACYHYFGNEKTKANEEIEYEIQSTTYQKREKLKTGSFGEYHWKSDQMGEKATIQNKAKSKIFVTKTERAISDDIYTTEVNNSIHMVVKYTDLNGNQINPSSLEQGTEINIIISVTNKDIVNQRGLALSLKMPSGWEILNPRLYKTAETEQDLYTYQDFRDDKVYTFFSLDKNQIQKYSFRAKANIKGDFYMPPVTCENMYRGEVKASTMAGRAKVR